MWLTLWIAVQSVGRNRPRNRTILERRLQQQVSTVSSDWTWPGSTTLFLGAVDGTRRDARAADGPQRDEDAATRRASDADADDVRVVPLR